MANFFYKGLIVATFFKLFCATVPKRCSILSTTADCYPHIPTILSIYGWDLSGVTTFRLLSDSTVWTLQTLPNDIFEMARDIKYLHMENAGLEKLPCYIFHPFKNSLKQIRLNNNLFQEFPICALQDLDALEAVYLSGQRLKSFQSERVNWKSIRTIILYNNEIRMLNISKINNQNQVAIHLSNNEISDLQISDVNHIVTLNAGNNRIRSVNRNIFQNSKSSLTFLDLSHNRLENSFWEILDGVSSLQYLFLKTNQISVIRSSVLNLARNLEYLDLSNNQLTSLAGVYLRSGKLEYLLLSSNRLTDIPPDITSSTATFNSNPKKFDLSNNSIENIHVSIPTAATSLIVRLDRNRLKKDLTFDNINIRIKTLNISHNDITYLPHHLPIADTFVLSYNPLDTVNIMQKLSNEMSEASTIEMENVGLFCGDATLYRAFIINPNLRSLNLNHNCVPLEILCHINTSCTNLMSLFLDNNTATQLSCSLRDKCFDVLSLNQLDLNDTLSKHIFGNANPKYFRKMLAMKNEISGIQLLNNTLMQNSPISCDFSKNRIKRFEGFEISGYSVTLNLESNKISSMTPGKLHTNGYAYVHLIIANNSLVNINDGCAQIFYSGSRFSNFKGDILIDLSFNYIKDVILKNIVSVIKVNGGFLGGVNRLSINMSHNSIEFLRDCVEPINLIEHVEWQLTLDVSYNSIIALPLMSCGMAYNMYLGHNKIRGIITPLPTAKTRILDLQWNAIKDIHSNAFDNLAQLTELNLRGNLIEIIPPSIKTLNSLELLDVSFNRIRHISQSNLDNLKNLQTLIITDNDFLIPTTDLQLGKLYHLEANEIHCDCQTLFLRNQSFSPNLRVSGRCTSPPEYEGYLVSCFPSTQCNGVFPLYIRSSIIDTCRRDKFSGFNMTITETENTIILHVRITGPRFPQHLNAKVYKNEEVIKQVKLNITGRGNSFFLDKNLEPNHLCLLSFFNDNSTAGRCFAIKLQNECPIDKTNGDNGTLYGISSLLAISLLVNILTGFVTFITCRNYFKKGGKRHSNVPERYEVATVIGSANGDSLSQPTYYDEIVAPERNDGDHAYTNLSLDL